MTTKPIGLYLHIPFCKRKCSYCDFCSYAGVKDEIADRYVDAVGRELLSYKRSEKIKIDTVFFGGGTPSLLSSEQLERLVGKAHDAFSICENSEITIEVNPATVTAEKLLAYKSLGINRISIGMQSIFQNELKKLGRIHTKEDFLNCYNNVRRAGIDNVSFDIMYGIPEQTRESFLKTLKYAVGLSPEHLSVYSLIVEPGTPFFDMQGSLLIPDEDTVCDMYYSATEILGSAEYSHYEISNYALPGFECRHNLKYWGGEEYIGVGISAYSYFNGRRYGNFGDKSTESDLSDYNIGERERFAYDEYITDDEKIKEYIMLRLRLRAGIVFEDYRALFLQDFRVGRERAIRGLTEAGLAVSDEERFALTEKGFFVSNSIISELI